MYYHNLVINVKQITVYDAFKDGSSKLAELKQKISQKMIPSITLQHVTKMSRLFKTPMSFWAPNKNDEKAVVVINNSTAD